VDCDATEVEIKFFGLLLLNNRISKDEVERCLKAEVAHSGHETIFVVWVHMSQRAVRIELDEADLTALWSFGHTAI